MAFPLVRANVAVMSIFRSLHVPVRGRLEMADLRARWPGYALRRRDLDFSIERLESLGFVEVDHTRNGFKYVVLTETGHRAAHSVLGLIESAVIWPRRLWRAIARTRRLTATRELRRRRMDRAGRVGPPR